MQYVISKIMCLKFAKPLFLCAVSETLYLTDHLIGNIAFALSSVYAIYKLYKEKQK